MGINEDILAVTEGSDELYEGLYQNYLMPPLCELPAHVRTTKQKLDMLTKAIPINGQRILDIGCANGALDLELVRLGATVIGIDQSEKSIRIARLAAMHLDLPMTFYLGDAETIQEGTFDVVLFMAVWKHIRWRNGMDAANATLARLSNLAPVMIFDPGLSDSGTDMGSPISHTQVPRLICECTDFPHMEMISNFIDNMNIEREVWKCWR
jgi:SAM-dependent methyltransferase